MSLVSQIEEYPWTFLNTTRPLTNYSANDIIAESDVLPVGYIGVVQDIAIIFTTAGGTIAWNIKHASGGTTRITSAISATNTTGTANIVLGHDDKVQLVVTTAGVGVIDVTFSGKIRKTAIPSAAFPPIPVNLVGTGGF